MTNANTPNYGDPLAERETHILTGMARGLQNAEIGRELYLAEDTIKTYQRRLFRKLGARNRAHAVAIGCKHHLIKLSDINTHHRGAA